MIRSSLVVAFGLLAVTSVQAAPVVNGSTTYDFIHASGISWADANTAAQGLGDGWHLATITSSAEQTFLQNNVVNGLSGEFWLGGYQIGETWAWVTGETWSYTNWQPGEPNDNTGPGSENHLATWSNFAWKWNDEGALGNITGYIVEHNAPAVPEPGTMALMGLGLVGLGLAYRRKA